MSWGSVASTALAAPLPLWDDIPLRSVGSAAALWPNPTQTLGDASLLVATVQTRAAYETLAAGAKLEQDWSRVDPARHAAYLWMSHQMRGRGCSDNGALNPPLWVWVRLDEARLADELALFGDESVLLVAEVPTSRCVLSVHDAWHHVLNQSWCPAPGRPDDAYEQFDDAVTERLGRSDWWFEDLPVDLKTKFMASWKWCMVPDLYGSAVPLQAALPHLWAHEVVGATRFA